MSSRVGKRNPVDKDIGAKLGPDHLFHDLIAEAYDVFDGPRPTRLGVCEGCCMEPEIEADFFSHAARDLPLPYVRDWFFAAADPEVPKATWRFLLPRVLEILAWGEDDPSSVGIEVSLSRFPTGDRDQWTGAQWSVLERFAAMFLDAQKTNSTDYLDDVLCMFGLARFDLDPLLARLDGWSETELATKLHRDWHLPYGGGSIWITAFWEAPLNTRVFEWYTSRRLYDRMEAYGLHDDTPRDIAERALAVADTIRANADRA